MLALTVILCLLFGLGSSWTQANTCYVRQPTCGVEGELRQIRETLGTSQGTLDAIEGSLADIAYSFRELIDRLDPPTTDPITTSTPSNGCGGPGWRQVAYINMNDPQQNCPEGLNETSYPIRTCGRARSGQYSCTSSVTFPTGGEYSQVCGRVKAYQFGVGYAFQQFHFRGQTTIDDSYADGLLFTHGQPLSRSHIWTFAMELYNGTISEISEFPYNHCPCTNENAYGPPPFVGDNYFCDSAATVGNWNANPPLFYSNNALWDGQGCEQTSNMCCIFNNPPWFTTTLPNSTTDDIEMRMCHELTADSGNIGIELLELYVL